MAAEVQQVRRNGRTRDRYSIPWRVRVV